MADYELRITNYELCNVYWLHSTKKKELFVCGGKWAEPTLVEIKSFVKDTQVEKNTQWAGELIPEHRRVIDELGWVEAKMRPVAEVLPEFLEGLTYERKIVEPWYGRKG